MSKKLLSLLLAVGCVWSFSACSSSGTAATTAGTTAADTAATTAGSRDSAASDDVSLEEATNIMQAMETANTDDSLLEKYDKVAFNYTYTLADGTETTQYAYQDADRYVTEYDGYIYIDEYGDVYGYDQENGKAFRCLFVGDAYDAFHESEWLAGFKYDEVETVLSLEENDGMLLISTEVSDTEFVDTYASLFSYEAGAFKKLRFQYQTDADSYEILASTIKAQAADGTETTLMSTERVDDPETYTPDAAITVAVFEGDQRTLTLTVDAGTAAVRIFTQTVTRGSTFQIHLLDSHDTTLYLDAAYSEPSTGTTDDTSDKVVYVKSSTEQ